MRAIVGEAACARQGHLGWTCHAGRKHVSPQQADDNRGDRLRVVPSSPKTTKAEEVVAMFAVAIMAYLLLLQLCAKDIPADRPWSAFLLQRALAWEGMQGPYEPPAH